MGHAFGSEIRPDPGELIRRFAELCAADDRIVAAMVTGSHARGEADEHSDVDLCAITTDAAFDSVLTDRESLIRPLGRRLGAPLFMETFGHPSNVHFILADGSEGELLCERESALDGLDVGPFLTLIDKRGLLTGASFPFSTPDPEEQRSSLTRILTGFWHDLSHLTAALGRGDLWWAAGQLESLRGSSANLVRIHIGIEAEDEPFEKLGTAVPGAELAALEPTYVPLERAAMRQAALEVVSFFREVGHRVAAENDVPYPDELDRLISRRLDAVREFDV